MTAVEFLLALMILALIFQSIAIVGLSRRLQRINTILDHTRAASYELSCMFDDSIKDLQESLDKAGIERSTDYMDERTRRLMLSPEQRHAESLAKWEATCSRLERLRRREGW